MVTRWGQRHLAEHGPVIPIVFLSRKPVAADALLGVLRSVIDVPSPQ